MEGSRQRRSYASWIVAFVLIFALMGTSVYAVAKRTYDDMSDAAIRNLNENLNLMQNTVEAIMRSEAEFQQLIADEIGQAPDPLTYVLNLRNNETTSKMSVVLNGQAEGLSNNGEPFNPADLDFSAGGTVLGLPISQSYVNDRGTWAYTVACPITRDGASVGTLYSEYVYDAIDQSLPQGFYDQQAVLYLMDAATERFVLKPEGMGERDAGHLNLEDFYRANNVVDEATLALVNDGIASKESVLFAHDVKGRESLCYLWSINGGTTYLVGYVPMAAIQQEAEAVNVAIGLVIGITAAAFVLCVVVYALNRRKQLQIQRAREAERALHNEQLTRALKAAEVANESKSAFLANMSHDIRTPMNAVLGFTTIIEKEADNPAKVRDCASKIMASGRHLLDLINDVLDISKIESGKATLTLEEFDLGDSLAAVESIIAPMAADKGQIFRAEVEGVRHERLIGDETHLNQILINLLSNAVKYTPEGGSIWLRFIGLPQHSSQLERIRIEVEDNGYGMTPEFLETIFDSFTRAENSTTNKVQGTGLGMSITKSLVELMGGTIEAHSVEGEGSLFRVDLELRIPDEQAQGFFWSQQGIARMLVVDPTAAGREVARTQMEGTGVVVDTVVDEAEARAVAAEVPDGFQLVLFNCDALDADAVAAGVALRREVGSEAEVPLVFVLGHSFDAAADAPLPPRAGILVKPFFVSTLKHKIEEITGVGGEDEAAAYDAVLQGKHFLAAEDNFLNAGILTELLELEGATVEIVENGQLAVERFERCVPGEFDAILMDVQMPVMNGHAASRAIRALARDDALSIPIIAMTADAFVEDEKAALAAGMNAHVAKPLEIGELKKVVDHYVEKGLS
ncbi:ATP-binding protein [Adlercreutzia sp. R7]|uniref:histidine kinase n=1 Tax=Adlercreutzia wanghongyangiae TaxID=3111451 RepID=A0ABU6IGG4_9ACTN|nr:ATP-binding protein [Adlercreutzia sp. R7]